MRYSRLIVVCICWYVGSYLYATDRNVRPIPAVNDICLSGGELPLASVITVSFVPGLEEEASMLRQYLQEDFRIKAETVPTAAFVDLQIVPSLLSQWEGSYSMEIDSIIRIKAASPRGVFYGIQTLRQLVSEKEGQYILPQLRIQDYPAFQWRAFMLDEARSFKGKEVVKGLLDEMARLKLNVFHWHLTDDQGWRIEITEYPELTRIGAWRDSTQIGGYKGTTYDGARHGGYYTRDDIKEIVDYAARRHIQIVPEFEMPGHESAAIAAYPWLGTTGKAIKVPCRFGVQYEVMDVTSPRVRRFVENVLDEIISMFPSPVIHIGGDEVKYDQWKESESVQAYMQQHQIETPADLQILFTNDISYLLQKKGRRMMGWNDITGNKIHEYHSEADATAKQKLASGTIVQFWKGDPALVEQTVRQGYDVVNSYHYMTYLDYDYEKIPLKQAYEFTPLPEELPQELVPKVLGLGCQMWGEETLSDERMYSLIFPRIAAYAESGWTSAEKKNYNEFVKALPALVGKWKAKGYQVYETKE